MCIKYSEKYEAPFSDRDRGQVGVWVTQTHWAAVHVHWKKISMTVCSTLTTDWTHILNRDLRTQKKKSEYILNRETPSCSGQLEILSPSDSKSSWGLYQCIAGLPGTRRTTASQAADMQGFIQLNHNQTLDL